MSASLPGYVLVTPARNEERMIGMVIESVAAQTHRPVKWCIVSDGSTDRTDEIVGSFSREHPWIELLRVPEHGDRQFAAKARAFRAGYERVRDYDFEVVGNLDADITFDAGYFEYLLGKFAVDPELGVAGTPFVDDHERTDDNTYAHRFAQLEHVSGACQLFRRECFEEVGGYREVKGGAIDWIAVTTARMKGWKTRTFTDMVCLHHRPLGTGTHSKMRVFWHYGKKAYFVGGHPLWILMRGFFQMRRKPWIVGGALFLGGAAWAWVTRTPRVVSPELMAFHRGEQMERLRRIFSRRRRSDPAESGRQAV